MPRQPDLPVELVLPPRLETEVGQFVEAEMGWQVIRSGGPLRPALRLAQAVTGAIPTVVVLGEPDTAAVRAALLAGAIDVIAWPDERSRLLDLSVPRARGAGLRVPRLDFGGVTGGAGTSLVALAAGALAAWSGHRVIVVGGEDLLRLCSPEPWEGPGTAELALLEPDEVAPEIDRLARAVRGVPRLSVLGGGAEHVATTEGWPADVVVTDLRGDAPPAARVLVSRPGTGLASVRERAILLNGAEPSELAAARKVLTRPPLGCLPWSARVARAAANGRVPGALPRSWLDPLGGALRTALSVQGGGTR